MDAAASVRTRRALIALPSVQLLEGLLEGYAAMARINVASMTAMQTASVMLLQSKEQYNMTVHRIRKGLMPYQADANCASLALDIHSV